MGLLLAEQSNTRAMFTDILSKAEKFLISCLVAIWSISVLIFYIWWFESAHVGALWPYILTTFVISWPLLVFGYCFFFLLRMKRIRSNQIPLQGMRVAIVVTKAPSEPLPLVQKTLLCALSQKYSHDTWVADEDVTAEAAKWYKSNNVKISSRKDHPLYHNHSWPRRKKCKEGNLAYFYDHYGYSSYDVVVHMDADHQPQNNYLESMLRPFSDPSIGYVAAPSVCDLNMSSSWASRARMHSEGMFHGPIQAGSNNGWVPGCIGSHYAVRVKALEEVGGIGPELAEDYSTTLLLNAGGWRGVCVYDARARGEGPHSFGDIMVQEYQWSRSLFILAFTFYPKMWGRLSWKQRLHFTFTQQWYPTTALAWLGGIVTICYAIISGTPPVIVDISSFLYYILVPYGLVFVIFTIVQRKKYFKPSHANLFTWENFMFELSRWPWVIVACIDGALSIIKRKQHTFVITSKGKASSDYLHLKIVFPYIVVVLVLMLCICFRSPSQLVSGYLYFGLVLIIAYISLCTLVLCLHIVESVNTKKISLTLRHGSHLISVVALTLTMLVLSAEFIKPDEFFDPIRPEVLAFVATSTSTQSLIVLPDFFDGYEYVVEPGDTLRSIAKDFLGNSTAWPSIKRKIAGNPNVIYVGEKVIVPMGQ